MTSSAVSCLTCIYLHTDTKIVAYHDTRALPQPTICHSECERIVAKTDSCIVRCQRCTNYRRTLHAMSSREKRKNSPMKTNQSSHTNYQYFSTPEKIERLRCLHQENRSTMKKLDRLRNKIAEITASRGVSLSEETTEDLHKIMEQEEDQVVSMYPPHSFQYVFWQQQKKAASCKDKRGM